MAQIVINTGTAPNTGNGEPLRNAFTDINTNFSALWPLLSGNDLYINAANYGVDANNSDNSTYIQAAINAAIQNKAQLIFPSGTFITNTVTVPSGVFTIRGAGQGNTVFVPLSSGNTVFHFNGYVPGIGTVPYYENGYFGNLSIQGFGSEFTGTLVGTALTVNSINSGPPNIGQTLTGPGILAGTIVTGGTYPNYTVNQSSGNLGPEGMGSFTGTGDGIYLDGNVSMFNFEFANISITGMGGVGLHEAALGNAFTVQYNNISCGLNGGHQFDIFGGNTVSLRSCFAGFVPTPECAGYRIRSGATLYTCNGTDIGDYWLIMGNAGPYSFTATGGSTTTAVLSGATYAPNVFLGQTITDTTTGYSSVVTGNTATTITFSPAMAATISAGNSITLGGELGGAQNSPVALIGCNLESFNIGAIRSRNSGPVGY